MQIKIVTIFRILGVLILIVFAGNACSQGIETSIISLRYAKAGKTIIRKFPYRISSATFLGTIRNKDGTVQYYVVKEFFKIKAAIVYHGHSRVLFFDKNKHLKAQTIFDMPDELPFKLQKRSLYFKKKAGGIIIIIQEALENNIPKILCGTLTTYEK